MRPVCSVEGMCSGVCLWCNECRAPLFKLISTLSACWAPTYVCPTFPPTLQIHTGANQDLFHYRHSGGICPAEYKMEGTRLPAPQLSPPPANAARDAFFAARLGYAQNRVRSKMSDSAYA